MNVALTGAAGLLGREVWRVLLEAGHSVRPTDRVTRAGLPGRVEIADLLLRHEVYRVLDGVEAVVHLGNHPYGRPGDIEHPFVENVTVNMNVFTAACDVGVRLVVFASSIQVVSGARAGAEERQPSCLAYLPLDQDTPPCPGNPYALGKRVSEIMLEFHCRQRGLRGVALRFPHLIDDRQLVRRAQPVSGPLSPHANLDEAFARLGRADAGRLIAAILAADLPGYRCYLPAVPENQLGLPLPEIVRRFYPNVPLRRPLQDLTSLVDISRITAETGWTPRPAVPAPPP